MTLSADGAPLCLRYRDLLYFFVGLIDRGYLFLLGSVIWRFGWRAGRNSRQYATVTNYRSSREVVDFGHGSYGNDSSNCRGAYGTVCGPSACRLPASFPPHPEGDWRRANPTPMATTGQSAEVTGFGDFPRINNARVLPVHDGKATPYRSRTAGRQPQSVMPVSIFRQGHYRISQPIRLRMTHAPLRTEPSLGRRPDTASLWVVTEALASCCW